MADQISNTSKNSINTPVTASQCVSRAGLWLRDNQTAIRTTQRIIVLIYVLLLFLPLFAPIPTRFSHIWSNAVLFAQFAFWGVWWPFVLVSMVLIGRSWCGLFCPEGALAEFASRYGRGRAIPHWIKWKGWPFVAFACTTIYGQMVSVYQYPKPAIIVLGGSTLAAMAVGFLYGRDKRVWCRYLCPVNGVFGLLSKLAPLHYKVNLSAWAEWNKTALPRPEPINCAPLVPIKTMRGGSACHMCGRCADFKGAVRLELRAPSDEIVNVPTAAISLWETLLIVFGLIGLAGGAFQWASSPIYVSVKQNLAEWLVDHGATTLIEFRLPWWILTNYPDQNDVMTLFDGVLMVGYVLTTALATGLGICIGLALATKALGRFKWSLFHHLAQGLIPVAGCGVFLGLSSNTLSLLKVEGLELAFIPYFRITLLLVASLTSLCLMWMIAGRYTKSSGRRLLGVTAAALCVIISVVNWILLFWLW